jgi:hypothetical protein
MNFPMEAVLLLNNCDSPAEELRSEDGKIRNTINSNKNILNQKTN